MYVQPDDDVATICGKIDTAAYQRVLLVAPRGNKALKSLLGMTILRRHAEVTGRDIAIVSNRGMRSRANRQGIKNFGALRNARFDANPPTRLIIPMGDTDLVLPPYRALARFAIITTILVTILAAGYLLIPSASITIYPEGRIVSQNLTVLASTTDDDVNLDEMRMPASFLEAPIEMNMAIPTTGTASIGDAFAVGTALFTNRSEETLPIPKETRVATTDGTIFATTEEAILPAGNGQLLSVPIQAVRPGTKANVGANLVTMMQGPLQNRLGVTNPTALSGGTDKQAQGVSGDDVANLRALVVEAMKAQGIRVLAEGQTTNELYLYVDTARSFTDEETPSHQVGEATPWLIMTTKGRVRILTTKFEDLQKLADYSLVPSAVEEGEPKVVNGTLQIVDASISEIDEVTTELSLHTEMEVVDGLDEAQIVDNLKGRGAGSAKTYLEDLFPMKQAPDIDITPGWGFDISRFDWRINFDVSGSLTSDDSAAELSGT